MLSYKNILLIQLRQLGDILLTTPCIREIRKECPDARITFMCHQMGTHILKDNPFLDEIITYSEKSSLFQQAGLLKDLNRKRFDLVIDFMNNPRSALASFLSQAPLRVAFRSARKAAYSLSISRPERGLYIVREKFMLLRACGMSPEDISLTFPWTAEDLRPWENFRASLPQTERASCRVILSPTHRRSPRKWPLHRYAALADYLTLSWGAIVIWIWGPGEESEIDQAMQLCQHQSYKAPATSLPQLAAFCSHQDLFVGNSNGPSHIAVAANIHTLQLHGPTEAAAWCPETRQHQSLQAPHSPEGRTGNLDKLSLAMVTDKLESMKQSIMDAQKQRTEQI
ncbi:MAG: glycosyltransferase family 9 protein [Deltaproteobacteria bacterium]|nr:glycosyltransferase family 9 protein [Deltaproteobacteria bacterium]